MRDLVELGIDFSGGAFLLRTQIDERAIQVGRGNFLKFGGAGYLILAHFPIPIHDPDRLTDFQIIKRLAG